MTAIANNFSEKEANDIVIRPPRTKSKAVAISKTGACVPENTGTVQLLQELLRRVLCKRGTTYWCY